MNSFILKVGKWIKKSAFGLIITSIALVFVICVGVLINEKSSIPVTKPTDSVQVLDSNVASSTPSIESQAPIVIEKIRMPFTVNAKIARYFFDSSDSIDIKSQALVNYDNKFVPSLGVDYTYENEQFSVVNAFKGKVVEKVNDSLYGLTIIIESEEGLRAHYCGLSDVGVYVDEEVKQGQVIGRSGESVINAELGNHLHFAIEFEDRYLNPLKAYDKTITEVIQ